MLVNCQEYRYIHWSMELSDGEKTGSSTSQICRQTKLKTFYLFLNQLCNQATGICALKRNNKEQSRVQEKHVSDCLSILDKLIHLFRLVHSTKINFTYPTTGTELAIRLLVHWSSRWYQRIVRQNIQSTLAVSVDQPLQNAAYQKGTRS